MAGEQRSPVQTRIGRSFSSFKGILVSVGWFFLFLHRGKKPHVKQHPDAKGVFFLYNRERYAHGNEKENEKNIHFFCFFVFLFFFFWRGGGLVILCVCVCYFLVVANNRFQQPQDKSVGIATKSHEKFQGDMQSGSGRPNTTAGSSSGHNQSIDTTTTTTHTNSPEHTHKKRNREREEGRTLFFLFPSFYQIILNILFGRV